MKDKRIFIAVDISEEARNACVNHIELLRKEFPFVRVGWERPEKLHLTLKFLGSMAANKLAQLKSEIAKAAKRYAAFDVALSETGVFPSLGKPRILWIGVDDSKGVLAGLAASIETISGVLGYDKDDRAFRPHLTIGRIREPQSARALARLHLETQIEPVRSHVADVVIYESKLQPTGSVYSAVSRANLNR